MGDRESPDESMEGFSQSKSGRSVRIGANFEIGMASSVQLSPQK
jgi:hypothetical protein